MHYISEWLSDYSDWLTMVGDCGFSMCNTINNNFITFNYYIYSLVCCFDLIIFVSNILQTINRPSQFSNEWTNETKHELNIIFSKQSCLIFSLFSQNIKIIIFIYGKIMKKKYFYYLLFAFWWIMWSYCCYLFVKIVYPPLTIWNNPLVDYSYRS